LNQGDGAMPASQGKLYLSTDSVIDLLSPDIEELVIGSGLVTRFT